MKNVLAIDIHSISDVITNSSTDLFIVNGETRVSVVREILVAMLDEYNDRDWRDVSEYDQKSPNSKDLSFDEVFEEPYIFTKDMVSKERYTWDYERKSSIGKVIISGSCDNTIPYDIMEEIQNTFNANWHHLG